jgi:hypothetical protein
VQLYRYFVSKYIDFCRHNPLCCLSTSVYCCYFVIDSVRKLLNTASYKHGDGSIPDAMIKIPRFPMKRFWHDSDPQRAWSSCNSCQRKPVPVSLMHVYSNILAEANAALVCNWDLATFNKWNHHKGLSSALTKPPMWQMRTEPEYWLGYPRRIKFTLQVVRHRTVHVQSNCFRQRAKPGIQYSI